MERYRTRHIEKKLAQFAQYFKIVLVTGARQVGKSTMLAQVLPDIKTFVLDPVQDIYGARQDPDLFLDTYPPPLILDEIQFVPELLPALKRRVDRLDSPGQYYLSGSQNLSMLRSVAESMAGRVGIISMEGLTWFEMVEEPEKSWLGSYLKDPGSIFKKIHAPAPKTPLHRLLWRGNLPGILDMPDEIVPEYFRSYIQTYVERDVRLLENIRELAAFGRFLGLSAALCAQEINASQLGREIGITPATSRRWLDLLENTFQWRELFPYHGNTIKRVSGKRKGFWRDSGICCYLQRISSPESLAVSPMRGALFESWVTNELSSLATLLPMPPQLYHWRTSGGAEVDLVMELDGRLFPIEMKCKTNLTRHDTRGLRAFRDTYGKDKVAPAIIVYAGHECYRLNETTTAIPWQAVLG